MAAACGPAGRSAPPTLPAASACAAGAPRREVPRHRAPARAGAGRGRHPRARRRGRAARGLGQRGARVSVDARRGGGTAHARHRPGGRGGPQGPRRGAPGGLPRRLPGLSGSAERRLPCWHDVCAPRPAGPPAPAPLGPPAGAGRGARGHTAAAGPTAGAPPPGRPGRRTRAAPGPDDAHGRGRTGAPDRAASLGALGAPAVQLLSRPRPRAAAGGLLPGLLPCRPTASELAAAVAAASAHTPRRAWSPRAGAHAGDGRRLDRAWLDLACAAHGPLRAVGIPSISQ